MTKSPVNGFGRNRKHRPRGVIFHCAAGNVNMKGKKYKSMYCGCRECIDFREKLLKKQHLGAMKSHDVFD